MAIGGLNGQNEKSEKSDLWSDSLAHFTVFTEETRC